MEYFLSEKTFDDRVRQIEMKLNDTEDDIIAYIRKHKTEIYRYKR